MEPQQLKKELSEGSGWRAAIAWAVRKCFGICLMSCDQEAPVLCPWEGGGVRDKEGTSSEMLCVRAPLHTLGRAARCVGVRGAQTLEGMRRRGAEMEGEGYHVVSFNRTLVIFMTLRRK